MDSSFLIDYFRPSNTSYKPKGEELIGVQLTNFLIQKMAEGKCTCVWTHVANEGTTKNGALKGARLRNQGKWAGVYDYIFTRPERPIWLELKTEKGRLSVAQQKFGKWCDFAGVPHYVAWSLKEAKEILLKEGIVHP